MQLERAIIHLEGISQDLETTEIRQPVSDQSLPTLYIKLHRQFR